MWKEDKGWQWIKRNRRKIARETICCVLSFEAPVVFVWKISPTSGDATNQIGIYKESSCFWEHVWSLFENLRRSSTARNYSKVWNPKQFQREAGRHTKLQINNDGWPDLNSVTKRNGKLYVNTRRHISKQATSMYDKMAVSKQFHTARGKK